LLAQGRWAFHGGIATTVRWWGVGGLQKGGCLAQPGLPPEKFLKGRLEEAES